MKRLLLASCAVLALGTAPAPAADHTDCPAITVADSQGLSGAYPQQFELAEFEAAAGCQLGFIENPEIAALNAEIQGNPDLPPVAERLPAEPLVVVPYEEIGTYGGTLRALSNNTESGTSDFLSIRHVNFVRFSDDLQTIVPNVAKGWEWNSDYTQLTFFLREGHKWSDGEPFTSADVKFWYDNLNFDPNIIEKPKDFLLVGGERMTVETPDATTVVFELPAPKPGLLSFFATSYAMGFQPKHFLGQYHPEINPDADKLAQEIGFEKGYDVINAYYGRSDWADTPTPMLTQADKVANMLKATTPTLEAFIVVDETAEGRKTAANPYFFMVDTQGQQLPYISRQDERYINEDEVRILKMINAEIDYKSQSVQLPNAPVLLENQANGDYTVELKPTISLPTFSFNVTSADEEKRAIFGNRNFREAMSIAIDRDEINETAFFGQGRPKQYVAFSPSPSFLDPKWETYKIEHDPEAAQALLDELDVTDKDGDGFRDLPSGAPLALNLQFAQQGAASQLVELVGQHWANIGIKTSVKEVTPDEYRSAQSGNLLDVHIWEKGAPLPVILGTPDLFIPPYDDYFTHRNAMLWGEWVESNGESGIEPPAYAKQMIEDIAAFQSATPGSDEQNALGARLVETMVSNLLFIGTVQAPNPVYHRNALMNVPSFKTWSYEFYRTYPYRGHQWFLADAN